MMGEGVEVDRSKGRGRWEGDRKRKGVVVDRVKVEE